jgi:hypothetical protein
MKQSRDRSETPRPERVIFEICLAVAGFLCVAVLAELVEMAIASR